MTGGDPSPPPKVCVYQRHHHDLAHFAPGHDAPPAFAPAGFISCVACPMTRPTPPPSRPSRAQPARHRRLRCRSATRSDATHDRGPPHRASRPRSTRHWRTLPRHRRQRPRQRRGMPAFGCGRWRHCGECGCLCTRRGGQCLDGADGACRVRIEGSGLDLTPPSTGRAFADEHRRDRRIKTIRIRPMPGAHATVSLNQLADRHRT